MASMTAGRCLLEYMKGEGTKYVFGIPGGASRALFDELYDFPDITLIVPKHEQGAGFMADGYARASGNIGFCTSTVAPGAANLAAGLLPAFADSVPILALTTNEPASIHGKSYIQDSSGWEPRTFDLVEMLKSVTKWSIMANMASRLPEIVTRALRIAMTGRRGPVHINLPWDVTKQEITTEMLPPHAYRPTRPPSGNSEEVRKAARLLAGSNSPAILSGGGVLISGASPELLELAELLAAPVATTIMGKSSFPEDHPLALGVAGLWGHDAANTVLKRGRTDVLLAIGCVFSQVTTSTYQKDFGADKIIHIDIDPAEIGKNYPVEIGIVGDAKAILSELIAQIKNSFSNRKPSEFAAFDEDKKDRLRRILHDKGEQKYYSEPEISSDAIPIKPQRALKEIREFLDREAIVLADSGNNFVWSERYMKAYYPRTYMADGLTHMGWSVNAAIGVKLGAPERQVLDICGNGSFQMTCKEVITAATYEIPVIWCIFNDGIFGVIKQAQKYGWGLYPPERYIGVDLYNMDFMKFAEACHVFGQRAERPTEIKDALKEAFSSGTPAILDILTDPEEMPSGSFVRYKPIVQKYPELKTKRMPPAKLPTKVLKE